MSRRRSSDVHVRYSIVVLKCPEDHVVGGVYQRPTGGYVELDETLHVGRERPIGATDKVKRSCDRCAAVGRRPDLQGSWSRIQERLAELDADANRGRVDYVLGG